MFKEAPLACEALIGFTTKGNRSELVRTDRQAAGCRSAMVRGAGMFFSLRSLRKKYLLQDSLAATVLLQGRLVPLKKWEILPFEMSTTFSGKKVQA